MERVLPSSLDYTKILPIAAGNPRQMRREFLPVNGQTFSARGNNIIRIELAASQFADFLNSYLRFRVTYPAGAATGTVGTESGGIHSYIRRLRLEQAGSILYDCNMYSKLLSAILLPAQGGTASVAHRSVTEQCRYGNVGTAANNNDELAAGAVTGGAIGLNTNLEAQIANGGNATFCGPLVGSLFDQEKLVPLQLLSSSPLTIEIELSPAVDTCINSGGTDIPDYTVDNVAYIVSLVDVDAEVDNQVRMIQELAGGHIVLNCNDWTHFNGNIAAGNTGQQVVNVPARRKSMKSILFCGSSQTFGANTQGTVYNQSFSGNFNMVNYQCKIGAIMHPATPIDCQFQAGGDLNTRGEALLELTKCFMGANNLIGMGSLNRLTYCTADCRFASMPTSGQTPCYSPFGIDLEAFQRTAIESGVNTADKSTPISLILNIGATNLNAINVDAYVSYDALYYIDQSGVINVSH